MGVNLSGVDVAVAKHALDNLNRDAGTEADGRRKGVAGAVRGEVLAQVHLFAEDGELPIVAYVGAVWQLEVVLLQDVEHDRQQHDRVALVCLLAMVVDQPVTLYLATLGEVHVE